MLHYISICGQVALKAVKFHTAQYNSNLRRLYCGLHAGKAQARWDDMYQQLQTSTVPYAINMEAEAFTAC